MQHERKVKLPDFLILCLEPSCDGCRCFDLTITEREILDLSRGFDREVVIGCKNMDTCNRVFMNIKEENKGGK